MGIDDCINDLMNNRILTEKMFKLICEKCKEILLEESNVQPVSAPVTICGDIHG